MALDTATEEWIRIYRQRANELRVAATFHRQVGDETAAAEQEGIAAEYDNAADILEWGER